MIFIITISFFLEGIISNLINANSYLLPLFTITSLVITYPLFNKEKKSLIIITSFIVGIMYDIAYTNSLFINTFTFILCSLLIILLYMYIPDNLVGKTSINLFLIVSFKFISYLLLFIFGFINFNQHILIKGILSSLILNIIYGLLLYYICEKITIKSKFKQYK